MFIHNRNIMSTPSPDPAKKQTTRSAAAAVAIAELDAESAAHVTAVTPTTDSPQLENVHVSPTVAAAASPPKLAAAKSTATGSEQPPTPERRPTRSQRTSPSTNFKLGNAVWYKTYAARIVKEAVHGAKGDEVEIEFDDTVKCKKWSTLTVDADQLSQREV